MRVSHIIGAVTGAVASAGLGIMIGLAIGAVDVKDAPVSAPVATATVEAPAVDLVALKGAVKAEPKPTPEPEPAPTVETALPPTVEVETEVPAAAVEAPVETEPAAGPAPIVGEPAYWVIEYTADGREIWGADDVAAFDSISCPVSADPAVETVLSVDQGDYYGIGYWATCMDLAAVEPVTEPSPEYWVVDTYDDGTIVYGTDDIAAFAGMECPVSDDPATEIVWSDDESSYYGTRYWGACIEVWR